MKNFIRLLTLCTAVLLGGCALNPGESFDWRKGLGNFNLGVDHVVDHSFEDNTCSVTSSLSPDRPPTVIHTGERKAVKHGLLPADGRRARLTAKCCPVNDDLHIYTWGVSIGRDDGYHTIGQQDRHVYDGRKPETCKAVREGRV